MAHLVLVAENGHKPPVPRRDPAATGLVGLAWVAHELKLTQRSPRARCRLVGQLIEAHGFPLPNPRLFGGAVVLDGAGVVTPASLWKRAEVENWLARRQHNGPQEQDAADRAHAVNARIAARLSGLGGRS